MQELRFVAVSEDGSYAVLAVPGRSARFSLPIDERLRAVALGQTSRLAQYEIEVESPLRPKEIQARIRAGETAEEIADAAGIPVERVRWFEGPVLAERAYIATQAQSASVRRAGDSAPGPRLGDITATRISALGGDPEEADWDSRKRGDGNWQVSLSFISGGRLHAAEWTFDPRRRHVMPADEAAERLSLPESELPPVAASVPGEATVTPLAPRLGAVAAGGMTSGATSGGYTGGSRYRQDRAGLDRTAMDRSGGLDRSGTGTDRAAMDRAATERPAHDRGYAERAAYDRGHAERPGYEPTAAYERPAAYTPDQPANYGSRSAPPAYTPAAGHGLVPMWEPPAWDPTQPPPGGTTPRTPRGTADEEATISAAQPPPGGTTPRTPRGTADEEATISAAQPAATKPTAPGSAPTPAAPTPTALTPTVPVPASAPSAAGHVAFDEEPEPVLSRTELPGAAHVPDPPRLDDTEFAAASVYLEVAEPTSAEPVLAQPAAPAAPPETPLTQPAAPSAHPAASMPPAKAKPAKAEPEKGEPAEAAPAQAAPAEVAPAKTASIKTAPAKTAPVTAGAAPAAFSAAAPAEAVAAEPVQAETAAAQALPAQPAAPGPVATTPAAAEFPPTPEPVSAASLAHEPVSADSLAAEAASPQPAPPEPASAEAAPAEAAPREPVAAEPAAGATATAQEASRPRQPKNAKAKGRRSSVPSWDEIMLGSSRQRD